MMFRVGENSRLKCSVRIIKDDKGLLWVRRHRAAEGLDQKQSKAWGGELSSVGTAHGWSLQPSSWERALPQALENGS